MVDPDLGALVGRAVLDGAVGPLNRGRLHYNGVVRDVAVLAVDDPVGRELAVAGLPFVGVVGSRRAGWVSRGAVLVDRGVPGGFTVQSLLGDDAGAIAH